METLQSTGKLDGTLLILLDPVPESDLQPQIDEAIVSIEDSGQVKVLIDQLAKQVFLNQSSRLRNLIIWKMMTCGQQRLKTNLKI